MDALLFGVSAKNYDKGWKDAMKVKDEINSCLSDEATVLFVVKKRTKTAIYMSKIRMLDSYRYKCDSFSSVDFGI